MIITTTSIAFIFLGLGLTLSGFGFLRAYKRAGGLKSGSKTGLLLSFLFIGYSFQVGIVLGLGTLFFGGNPEGLFFIVLVAAITSPFIAILGVYTLYYIFFARSSPWPLMAILILLGIANFVLTIYTQPHPFLTLNNSIDWNMSLPLSLTTFYLLFIGIGSLLYIFTQLFRRAETRELKIFSFIISAISAIGIISAFFVLVPFYKDTTNISIDIYYIVLGFTGIALLLTVVLFFYKSMKRNKL